MRRLHQVECSYLARPRRRNPDGDHICVHPNKAHRYKSDVTNEVAGTNYTAGGATLTTPVFAYNSATQKVYFDADNASWPGPIPASRCFIIYDATPATDATRPLIGVIIADSDRQPAGIQFAEPPPTGNGIFAIPV